MRQYFRFGRRRWSSKYQFDNSTDILFQPLSDVKWIPNNRLHIGNYTMVHYDSTSDVMVMHINTEVNTYTRVTQIQWLQDKLALSKAVLEEQRAHFAGIPHSTLKGLPTSIDPDRPPKNYKDAMSREDLQSWAEAYDKEYCGFKERYAFKIIRPEKGIKIHIL